MKKIALAAALSVAATSAFAGGAPEAAPAMEPAAVAKASSSGAGYIVPLLLLVALAYAAKK